MSIYKHLALHTWTGTTPLARVRASKNAGWNAGSAPHAFARCSTRADQREVVDLVRSSAEIGVMGTEYGRSNQGEKAGDLPRLRKLQERRRAWLRHEMTATGGRGYCSRRCCGLRVRATSEGHGCAWVQFSSAHDGEALDVAREIMPRWPSSAAAGDAYISSARRGGRGFEDVPDGDLRVSIKRLPDTRCPVVHDRPIAVGREGEGGWKEGSNCREKNYQGY